MKHKLPESRLPRRNINNLRYADNTTLVAEIAKELSPGLLIRMKEEKENAGLKLNA